jgi:hypothetical protein
VRWSTLDDALERFTAKLVAGWHHMLKFATIARLQAAKMTNKSATFGLAYA